MKLGLSTAALSVLLSADLSGGLKYSAASLPGGHAQEAGWTKETECGVPYWVAANVAVRNFPPSIRFVFLYVEPQTFTQESLRRIFLCISQKYVKPEYLKIIARSDKASLQRWIGHYIAVHGVRADGSFVRVPRPPRDLPDDLIKEVGFYRSEYDRSNAVEVITFSTAPDSLNMSGLTLSRNWPYRSSWDTTSDLVRASSWGLEPEVRGLLHSGSVNKTNKYGIAPLIAAISYHHRAVASLLIENGADVNQQDPDGWTPLMYALTNGDSETADNLLRAGADVNARADNGDTPLLIAIRRDLIRVVEELLRKGADTRARDRYGRTPLMIAVELGHQTAIAMLREPRRKN